MKNRKYPVLLFGIVVVAIGVMTVVNGSQKPQNPDGQAEQQQPLADDAVAERKLTEEDRAKASESLLSKLGSAASTKKTNKEAAMDSAALQNQLALQPTIFVQTTSSFRPQPNDASPATHWYDESSRSAKIAEQNEKSKG